MENETIQSSGARSSGSPLVLPEAQVRGREVRIRARSTSWAPSRAHALIVFVCALLIALLTSTLVGEIGWLTTWQVAAMTSGASLLAYAGVVWLSASVWSSSALGSFVLALFHVSLPLEIAVANISHFPDGIPRAWLWTDTAQVSMVAVSISMLGFTAGVALVGTLRHSFGVVNVTPEPDLKRLLATVGALLATVGMVAWLLGNIRYSGIGFATRGYEEYFQASQWNGTKSTYFPISLGMGLTALDVRSRLSRLSLGMFSIYAGLSLLAGARIHVIIAGVALIAVLSTQRKMPSAWVFCAFVIGGLGMISAIASVRLINSSSNESPVFDVFAGLREMGASLYAAATMISWNTAGGEPHANGATYIAPMIRGFNTLVGTSNEDYRSDPNMLIGRVERDYGGIGGSIVGEAYFNFGLVGCFIVLALWGALFQYLTSKPSVLASAFTALFTVLFLLQVRGFFGSIPGLFVLGSAVILSAVILTRALGPSSRGTVSDLT